LQWKKPKSESWQWIYYIDMFSSNIYRGLSYCRCGSLLLGNSVYAYP
jgi:hypothetical protein